MEAFGFVIIVYLVFQTTVVLHELGHAVFGWAAGFRIETIQIGSGLIVFQKKVKGVRIRYGLIPFSGYVSGLPKGTSNFRMRWFAFGLGGPFVTLSVIGFMLWVALGPIGAMNDSIRNCAWFLVVMEGFTIVPNLTPWLRDGSGGLQWNDGMLLLQATFLPSSEIEKLAEEFEYLGIGIDALENGVHGQKHDRLGQGIAAAYLRMLSYGEKDTALPLLKKRLTELEPEEKAAALNSIVSQYVATEHPIFQEDVPWMMKEALQADPKSVSVQATHGALLVLQGETDQGIEILERVLAEATEKTDLSAAGYFLALAYAADHYIQRSKEYWDRAFEIDPNALARFVVEPRIREYAEADRRRWSVTE